jgi:hypothetical protein
MFHYLQTFHKRAIIMTQRVWQVARQDDTGTSRREHWFSDSLCFVTRNNEENSSKPFDIEPEVSQLCSNTVIIYIISLM